LSFTQAVGAEKGQPKVREDLLDGMAFKYGNLQSLRSGYVRTTTTPSTDAVFKNQASQMASGVLFWKKAYLLKLEQTKPRAEDMLTDGSTAWWYIPEEKTVHLYKDVDLSGEFYPLTAFFDGLDELKKNFKISAVPEDKNRVDQFGFLLTPKKEGNGTITVWCDKNSMLTGFRLSAATGEQTDFVLENLVVNPDIPDSFFTFKPAKGVTVVEESMDGME
jgi:chaperone LolA